MSFNRKLLATAALIVILAILPLVVGRDDIINLMFMMFLSVTLAQSWNILGGYAGQVNLGHAAFFGVGTLVARYLWFSGTPIYVAMLVAGLVAVIFALIIGMPTFRLRGAYFAIGTLGVAETVRITVGNVLPIVTALPSNFIVNYDLNLRYYAALVLAVLTVLVTYWLVNSRTGLGIVAVREDEDAGEASGVSALKHKLIALAVSSFFAGVAGGLFAFYHVSYYYQFPFAPNWTFDALMITYIGGVGTLIGPVVGAFFYVTVREWLAVSIVDAHLLVFGAIFICVVLLLPGGLVEAWTKMQRVRLLSRLLRPTPPVKSVVKGRGEQT
ncbi:MAG: branched-chain amino acid ABC transporter permease [Dehalococcoidales bacterium]|nr:branched-chain amino acid ABC transporter permease [Dehalococcoidales bacterium]